MKFSIMNNLIVEDYDKNNYLLDCVEILIVEKCQKLLILPIRLNNQFHNSIVLPASRLQQTSQSTFFY